MRLSIYFVATLIWVGLAVYQAVSGVVWIATLNAFIAGIQAALLWRAAHVRYRHWRAIREYARMSHKFEQFSGAVQTEIDKRGWPVKVHVGPLGALGLEMREEDFKVPMDELNEILTLTTAKYLAPPPKEGKT